MRSSSICALSSSSQHKLKDKKFVSNCGHYICESCIPSISKSTFPKCLICRKVILLDDKTKLILLRDEIRKTFQEYKSKKDTLYD